jgi:hypothetical protein
MQLRVFVHLSLYVRARMHVPVATGGELTENEQDEDDHEHEPVHVNMNSIQLNDQQ